MSSDAWTNAQSEEWKVQPRERGAICKGPEEKLLAIFEELDRVNEKSQGSGFVLLHLCVVVVQFTGGQGKQTQSLPRKEGPLE